MDLVRADGWELTSADLSTYLIPKGISGFEIVQPRLRTWLLCILQQKPLATHNRWNWRPNRENLVGSCQSQSKSSFYKWLTCCAGSVCFWWEEKLLTSLTGTEGVAFDHGPCVLQRACYCHVRLSVKWTSPASLVSHNNSGAPPLIVWGEGNTPNRCLWSRGETCCFPLFYYPDA